MARTYSSDICQNTILEQITPSIVEQVTHSETIIQSHIKLKEDEHKNYKLKLTNQLILLYQEENTQDKLIFYIRLNFSIKFSKILQPISQQEQQSSNNMLKGFKIINQRQEINFYIEFPALTKIWVKELSKYINQTGFHIQFKPIRKLGKGSSATVYEIIRMEDGERFAAKVFSKQYFQRDKLKSSCFMNQIEILRRFNHKNLLKLQGVYETQQGYSVIMETLRGGNLFQYLTSRKSQLCLSQTKTIMRSIIKGLAQLETLDIVHRDIKLQNIMLRQKNNLQLVIIDFGLAVFSNMDDYIFCRCGTPGYLSPEIVKSKCNQKITPSSDVFSAGVILHVLLLARYLFDGKQSKAVFENNRNLNFDLSKPQYLNVDRDAFDLLKGMLAIQPTERYTASQCLKHSFLKQSQFLIQEQKIQISPASTSQNYQF